MASQSLHDKMRATTACTLKFDDFTRALYATDASVYQIMPRGVAFPSSALQASRLLQVAAEENLPIIPRGAGTGLAGGAVGDGLIVDFSRHNTAISHLNLEKRTVTVGAGVVLDQLNAYLKPHGMTFGPDVATSSRATLGGMIGNNSSGARTPVHGTTIDNVNALEIVLADGRIERVGGGSPGLHDIHSSVAQLVERHTADIELHCPPGLVKRWPGYGVDRWMRDRADLTRILGGSEGTLAAIISAELNIISLPTKKSMAAIFFDDLHEAMAATVDLLDLEPVAIEHIDRVLFDQTKGQLAFEKARSLLELDTQPCESILIVEFYDDNDGRLEALMTRSIGKRKAAFENDEDMQHIWHLRKAGLTLLTGCKGDAKPTAGIEDVSVRPDQLPEYVDGLRALMDGLGLDGSFYGHAASGLLHVRPVVDLHRKEDLIKYRQLADDVSALVRQFKGSIAAEHGVGIARTQYLADHVGPELMSVFAEIKNLFDPKGLMNPGKIIPTKDFTIDTNLRQGADNYIKLPFEPQLTFAAKDCSFVGNLEQCNGCGGCRKSPPTMCPTFAATGDEVMSTRGRANAIRASLELRVGNETVWSPELNHALATCLSCKACSSECPSNVNMPLLKAELLHARHKAEGLTLRERLLSRVDLIGKAGTLFPKLANAVIASGVIRSILEPIVGLSKQRPLPPFAEGSFSSWFTKHQSTGTNKRGRVILWGDCFTQFYEPDIGASAVSVLEAAGHEVSLKNPDQCCGRPAFSSGRLDVAKSMANANIKSLSDSDDPIIMLEPSCHSMFAEDYAELGVENGDTLASRAVLFEDFLLQTLQADAEALQFTPPSAPAALHGHCHTKSIQSKPAAATLAGHVAGEAIHTLNTGCCGMAGAFGALSEHYELSTKIAEPLVQQLEDLPDHTIIASGTSCRHQIEHLTGRRALHIAEYVAQALAP